MDQWVERAIKDHVTDIGQLGSIAKRALNAAVKGGLLVTAKAGPYPKRKTVWAAPGYDFEGARADAQAEMQRAVRMDQLAREHRREQVVLEAEYNLVQRNAVIQRKRYQRNNIQVRYSQAAGCWRCWSPDGELLYERQLLAAALSWATDTTDFLAKRG